MSSTTFIEYDSIPAQAWRRLEHAADDRDHPMRLMTLATISAAQGPDARLLVLRGASRTRRQLWFHTDARSRKIEDLRREPAVCAVAYDPRDSVQLRIFGRALLHTDDEIADQHWEQADIAVRTLYGSDRAPGEPLAPDDPRAAQHQEALERRNAKAGRANFLVIAIDVERVEWLQIAGSHQRRASLRRERDWRAEPLAP